jgi:hypothetical protein
MLPTDDQLREWSATQAGWHQARLPYHQAISDEALPPALPTCAPVRRRPCPTGWLGWVVAILLITARVTFWVTIVGLGSVGGLLAAVMGGAFGSIFRSDTAQARAAFGRGGLFG